MDDDNFLGNAAPAAGADDGAMVVHSAHSSPSRGRRKFTWLRKVAYMNPVFSHLYRDDLQETHQ